MPRCITTASSRPMSLPGVLIEQTLPLAAPLPAAAARIARWLADGALGNGQVCLLMPDQLMFPQMLEALRAELPETQVRRLRFYTLGSLAQTVHLAVPRLPAAHREVLLHSALRAHGWFDERQLWQVVSELTALFDELTLAASPLPDSLDAFIARLSHVYGLQPLEGLCFEAALAFNAWHAVMTHPDEGVDAITAYCLGLGQLARRISPPLVAIGLGALAPVEVHFLQAAAAQRPVYWLQPGAGEGTAESPLLAALSAAWPEAWAQLVPADSTHGDEPLRGRAKRLAGAIPANPLTGRICCLAADSLEQHARAVAATIQQWHRDGARQVAVLCQDRAGARRLQALLTGMGFLVADEMGWTLSTSPAAATVKALLEAAAAPTDLPRLRRLLLAPHLGHTLTPETQAGWRAAIGAYLARPLTEISLETLQEMVAAEDAAQATLLGGVRRALQTLSGPPRSLSDWLAALLDVLEQLGLTAAFQNDEAGVALLALCQQMVEALAWDTASQTLVHFSRWLHQQMENNKFREASLQGDVLLTSPEGARLRNFDGVVIFGADAAHFPGQQPAGQIFSEAVRVSLGLPSRAELFDRQAAMLLQIVAASPRILFSWQRVQEEGEMLPSPWVERLDALSECAWGQRLPQLAATDWLAQTKEATALPAPPAPILPGELMPTVLTPAACRALAACPYQFYAGQLLGLEAMAEPDAPAGQREFSLAVHRILERFGACCPRLDGMSAAAIHSVLQQLGEATFAAYAGRTDPCQDWLQKFMALIPAFIDWARARAADGWQLLPGRQRLSRLLQHPDGYQVRIEARIDRVEQRQIGGQPVLAMIDYRIGSLKNLRQSLSDEFLSAEVLSWLAGVPVAEAFYLNLDQGLASAVATGQAPVAVTTPPERLLAVLDVLHPGASLPASGTETTCRRCTLQGVCRRGHWAVERLDEREEKLG